MSSISAGLVNTTNLTVTGTQSGAVQATNFNTTNINATNANVTTVNTTDANATGQILSAGPVRDGVTDFLPTTRAQVQTYANNIITASTSLAPNFFVGYGNAKDASFNIVVSGKQSDGSALPADPYFRIASLTKLIGSIGTLKMMSDGWINMDTPIAAFLGNGWYDASGIAHGDMIPDSCGNIPRDASGQYIKPFLSKNRTIIDGSGVIRTLQAAYTAWALTRSPPFTSTASLNPCPDMTVSMCLNHTCGLTYDYFTIGKFHDFPQYDGDLTTQARVKKFGYSDFFTVQATGQVGSSFADPSGDYNANPANAPSLLIDASGNTTFTTDTHLSLVATQPSSSIPGLYSTYGRGYDILGFFVDQVIKQTPALSALYTDAVDYIQKTVLTPIGITDCWVMSGQTAAPADCQSRMVSAVLQRATQTSVRTKAAPFGIVDTSQNGLVSIRGVPVAKYAYTDTSGFTFTGYFDSSNNPLTVFADAVPNDTQTTLLNNTSYQKTKNTNLKHIGNFGTGWCMSVSSFLKILRLFANKGYDIVSKRRVISKAVFTFLMQSSVTETQHTGISDSDHFFTNAPVELSYTSGYPISWSIGSWKFGELSTIPYSAVSFTDSGGRLGSPIYSQPPLFPFAPGAHYWAGVFNNGWYMDPESGNFTVFGTQQAAWAGGLNTVFQPYRSSIRAVAPGPSPAYLGAAPVKSSYDSPLAFSKLVSILSDADTTD
jgi:CubicO group peptidase (beta-lactamase class C family)